MIAGHDVARQVVVPTRASAFESPNSHRSFIRPECRIFYFWAMYYVYILYSQDHNQSVKYFVKKSRITIEYHT
jgi:hypothetical protein